MIIYPRKRLEKQMCEVNNCPEFYAGKSEKGWITFECLFEYLVNGFNKWLTENSITRPVLVFTDWHATRANYFLAERLTSLGIVLIGLLPNTTHILQPLDVAVFGPMKKKWLKTAKEWRRRNPEDELTPKNFASVFIPFYHETLKVENIKAGFMRCGLYPFDADQPDYSKIEPVALRKGFPTPFAGINQSENIYIIELNIKLDNAQINDK